MALFVAMVCDGGVTAIPQFAMNLGMAFAIVLTALFGGHVGHIAGHHSRPRTLYVKWFLIALLAVFASTAFGFLLGQIPIDGELYESYFLLRRIGFFIGLSVVSTGTVSMLLEHWKPQSKFAHLARYAICFLILWAATLSGWGTPTNAV